MGAVVPISPTAARLLAKREAAPPAWCRAKAAQRLAQLRPLIDAIEHGAARGQALATWAGHHAVSVATARRWLDAYERGGFEALAPAHRGRKPDLQGMEGAILQLYNMPSRPNCGTIALWIREQTGVELSAGKIRRFIRGLPAIAAEQSASRMGRHTYAMKVVPYVERDATQFRFGEAVHADGHCMKVWCLHPVSGKPFRAEFTPILDIRSNYWFSEWLGEAESADTTVFALGRMIAEHHHAPTIFYTDPGPGFRNRRVAELFHRLGIEHMISRRGNSRGRGFGEGFFKLFIEREAKRYAACCSRDRTDDTLARFETKWKNGELYVPTFAEVQAHLALAREHYNRRPQPYSKRLHGAAPADLMEGWNPSGVALPAHELIRPGKRLSVRGCAVRTLKRRYVHPDLLAYERRKVDAEFDLFDLSHLWIWSPDGRFVCEANCAEAQPYVPQTYLEAARARSDAAKLKLLDRHADEVRMRSRRVISPAEIMDAFEMPSLPAPADPGIALLDQGHHIQIVQSSPKPRPPREPSAEARARVEEMAGEPEKEMPAERYAKALALAAATEISEADAQWLASYRTSPEFFAQQLVAEEDFSIGSVDL